MNNTIAAVTTGDISGAGKSQSAKEGPSSGQTSGTGGSGASCDNFLSLLSLLGSVVSEPDASSSTNATSSPASPKEESSSKSKSSENASLIFAMAGLMGITNSQQATNLKVSPQQTDSSGGAGSTGATSANAATQQAVSSNPPAATDSTSGTSPNAAIMASSVQLLSGDKPQATTTSQNNGLQSKGPQSTKTDASLLSTSGSSTQQAVSSNPPAATDSTSGTSPNAAIMASSAQLPGGDKPQATTTSQNNGLQGKESQNTKTDASLLSTSGSSTQQAVSSNPPAATPPAATDSTSGTSPNAAIMASSAQLPGGDKPQATAASGSSGKAEGANELTGVKPNSSGPLHGILSNTGAVAVTSADTAGSGLTDTGTGQGGQSLLASNFTAIFKPEEKGGDKIQGDDSSINASFAHLVGDNSSIGLSSATGAVSKDASTVTQPFQSDIVQQITQKAIPNLQAGQSHIQIDLKPESLGTLRLQVSSDQQQVTVRILADNSQVKDMIERQIPVIRSELQHSGIRVDSVDVGMMSNGSDFASSQHGSPSFNQAPPSSGNVMRQETTEAGESAPIELHRQQSYLREGSQISYFA